MINEPPHDKIYHISNVKILNASYYKDANEYLDINTENDLFFGAAFKANADFGIGNKNNKISGIHEIIVISTDKSHISGRNLSIIYTNDDGNIIVHHWENRNDKYGTCIADQAARNFRVTDKLDRIEGQGIWCLGK